MMMIVVKRRQILVGGNFESGGCQGKGLMSVKGILVLCSITFSQIRTNKYRAPGLVRCCLGPPMAPKASLG